MALTFPLATTSFAALLPVSEMQMSCNEQVEANLTGGGAIISAMLAPNLWGGEIQLGVMGRGESTNISMLLDMHRLGGRLFYMYDHRRPAPLLDPKGLLLSGYTASIYALSAGNREMRLDGLPPGYVLSAGDYLAWTYAGTRALHRVVPGYVAANGMGITPTFEVMPEIRPGASVGAVISLIKPTCLAKIVPGSINPGSTSRSFTRGMSFRFQQTLK